MQTTEDTMVRALRLNSSLPDVSKWPLIRFIERRVTHWAQVTGIARSYKGYLLAKWILRILVVAYIWFIYWITQNDPTLPNPVSRDQLPSFLFNNFLMILLLFGVFPFARWFAAIFLRANNNVIVRPDSISVERIWSWSQYAIPPDTNVQFRADRTVHRGFDISWVPWHRSWEQNFRWVEIVHGSEVILVGSMQKDLADQFVTALQIAYDLSNFPEKLHRLLAEVHTE